MAYVIAIVLGVLLGAAAGSVFASVAGGVLAYLLVRTHVQGNELAALRKRLDASIAAVAAAQPAASVATSAAAPIVAAQDGQTNGFAGQVPPMPEAATAAALALETATPATVPALGPPATEPAFVLPAAVAPAAVALPPTPRPPAARAPVMAPPGPGPFDAVRRWLVGGNTIVKAGIAILFVGLAFLAKYTVEHTQVPIELRLSGIGAAGLVLLVFGWRLRLRRPAYAQVLQGGAIAVLYLTLFAAFRFYALIEPLPAFVLMVVIAGLAAALAVLQDARSLAVIGALGGFATPLIVSTGSHNQIALFAYYFVLDGGIAAIAWSKTWRSLNLIGFVATYVVATAWGVLDYRPEAFASSEAFLVAFFLLFVTILVLPARRLKASPAGSNERRHATWVNSSLLFGLPTITFALQYGLVREMAGGAALSALGLAAFYVALAAWMRRRPELGITFFASLAIATIFLTLVVPFALDARSTAGAWALEGAGLVWIGFRQQRLLSRAFGYALLIVSASAMVFGHQRFGVPAQPVNAYLVNGVLAAFAALAAAWFVFRQRQGGTLAADEEPLEPLLIGLATLWLIVTAAIEIDAFVPAEMVRSAALVAAAAVAVLYAGLGRRLGWATVAWPAAALAPILFLGAAANALTLANPLADGGWWAWPLALAGHLVVLRLSAVRWPEAIAHLVHALGAITLALLGALCGRAATEAWGDPASAWPWLGWLLVPAALLFALPAPLVGRRWPVRALPVAYRDTAAGVIAAGLWLWTLVANIASDGSASPLPHLPLLNPLDIGIGLALVAIVQWLRVTGRLVTPTLAALAAAVFVWLNAMLLRAFHHWGGVPYDAASWLDSLAVQTGVTLLWTTMALAAMWFSARRGLRAPWVVGAVLLAIVVIKLVFVDLSGSGGVTRIVSFIGVGFLMMLIGYVAPLPGGVAGRRAAT